MLLHRSTLLSDDLTSAADASNWKITYGCGDPQDNATDFSATLAFSGQRRRRHPHSPAAQRKCHCSSPDLQQGRYAGLAGAVNVYYTNLS